MRRYAVQIDGKKVGALANGRALSFELAPGIHTLQMKIDWCGSQVEEFELRDGGEATFFCEPTTTLKSLKAVLFDWGSFIILRPVVGQARND